MTFLALFVLLAWYVHAASSNDYADRKIDAVNLLGAKNRPLVTKSMSYKTLWVVHFTAGALALLFASYYGQQAVVLTAIILAFDYAYSFKPFRLTDRGAISQLLLPLAYVYFPFSLGYWSTDTNNPYPWLLVTGLYVGFVARLFLKDFRDVKGDRTYGKQTYLLRHGRKITCFTSELFALSSLLLLCFAVHFSAGVVFVLIAGHVGALLLLRRLADTKDIPSQMRLIAVIAKIANASVVTLLVYFFSQTYLDSSLSLILLPGIIGSALLALIWKGYSNDAQA